MQLHTVVAVVKPFFVSFVTLFIILAGARSGLSVHGQH